MRYLDIILCLKTYVLDGPIAYDIILHCKFLKTNFGMLKCVIQTKVNILEILWQYISYMVKIVNKNMCSVGGETPCISDPIRDCLTMDSYHRYSKISRKNGRALFLLEEGIFV